MAFYISPYRTDIIMPKRYSEQEILDIFFIAEKRILHDPAYTLSAYEKEVLMMKKCIKKIVPVLMEMLILVLNECKQRFKYWGEN